MVRASRRRILLAAAPLLAACQPTVDPDLPPYLARQDACFIEIGKKPIGKADGGHWLTPEQAETMRECMERQ